MKVGILGSGDVGRTLAAGFLKHDHAVTIGTRTPEKLAEWGRKNPTGQVSGFDEAAKFAELVVLAVRGTVAREALLAARVANLTGKVVIDATNPISDAPRERSIKILHRSQRVLDGTSPGGV